MSGVFAGSGCSRCIDIRRGHDGVIDCININRIAGDQFLCQLREPAQDRLTLVPKKSIINGEIFVEFLRSDVSYIDEMQIIVSGEFGFEG